MIQKQIYRPELKDLYFLYKLITLNKRITAMEIGCGWSSLIIRKALKENKRVVQEVTLEELHNIMQSQEMADILQHNYKKINNIAKQDIITVSTLKNTE